jgi:photosystem II stability/assembly factor-like uncharacterized protein
MNKIFLATNDGGIARAAQKNDEWRVEFLLNGQGVNCLAANENQPGVVYAGTQGSGVLRSTDGGQTWHAAGLAGRTVKSLAISPIETGVIYAGLKPSGLCVSRDHGDTWIEIEAFTRARSWWWRSPAEADLRAYVQGIALSPTDPNVIVVGIEAGAVLRSSDGGKSWQGHRPGALRDCHSITFHVTNGDWAYEGGGTGAGVSFSRDGGQTWRQPKAGLDRHYGWAVAADPARPEVWYVSLSPMIAWKRPGPPAAHVDGYANAAIYRSVGGEAWQKLGGSLPQPLNYMAYALLTDPTAPGHLYAGLSNGDVWHSTDHGDSWQQLPFNLKGIHRVMILTSDNP